MSVSCPDEASQSVSRDRKTSTTSIEDQEVEMLARATMPPERMEPLTSRAMNMDGAPPIATPESNKHRQSVRRSLQKTLRDSHHHPSTTHKHKKGKESDSTVRSAGGAASIEGEDVKEGTPGLKREQGRFILHGKQASVVKFNGEWAANERMKARREAFRSNSSGASPPEESSSRTPFGYWGARADVLYPMVHDFSHESDSSPPNSSQSNALVQDAEAAEAFARSESPVGVSSASEFEGEGAAAEFYDAFQTQSLAEENKRTTVIGPKQRRSSLQKGDDGYVVSATEEEDEDGDEEATPIASKRQTVIGPAKVNGNGITAPTNGGAEEEVSNDESIDDEMRHVSPQSRPIQVA